MPIFVLKTPLLNIRTRGLRSVVPARAVGGSETQGSNDKNLDEEDSTEEEDTVAVVKKVGGVRNKRRTGRKKKRKKGKRRRRKKKGGKKKRRRRRRRRRRKTTPKPGTNIYKTKLVDLLYEHKSFFFVTAVISTVFSPPPGGNRTTVPSNETPKPRGAQLRQFNAASANLAAQAPPAPAPAAPATTPVAVPAPDVGTTPLAPATPQNPVGVSDHAPEPAPEPATPVPAPATGTPGPSVQPLTEDEFLSESQKDLGEGDPEALFVPDQVEGSHRKENRWVLIFNSN